MGWDEHTCVLLGVRVPPAVFFKKVNTTVQHKCRCPSVALTSFCANCGWKLRETIERNDCVFKVDDIDPDAERIYNEGSMDKLYINRIQVGSTIFDMVVVPDDYTDDDKNDRVIGLALFENNTIRRAGGEIYRTARPVPEEAVTKMREVFLLNGLPQDIGYHLVVHGSG